jgi:outer membrane autotransporter protein
LYYIHPKLCIFRANVFPFTGPTQVRIAWGNAIGNTNAYVMNNPGTGTGGNKITILEFLTSNTDAAFSTNMTGNTNLISGTGSSCSGSNCQSLGYYSSYTNPK